MSELAVANDASIDTFPAGWERRCQVLSKVKVTSRYHRRRQRFFDLLDKVTKALTMLLGGSLFGPAVAQYLPWIASAIASLSLLNLVFGYSDRKQVHKELGETAFLLAAKIEESPLSSLSDALAGQWAAELERLNAKEPPPLKTLVIICEHEQATAEGHPNHVTRPNWLSRLIADFI